MPHPIRATKEFVERHKVALTFVATATPLIALHVRNTHMMNNFLAEKGLLDEYYFISEV